MIEKPAFETSSQLEPSPETDEDNGPYHEDTGVFDLFAQQTATQVDRSRLIAGRYEIVNRIGAGGMGQVVHVRHIRLGKSFALKLMQAEHAFDPSAIELFRSEAHLASTLCHPNIVSVVDFGEDPDWGLFIAMEYLEGEVLSTKISIDGALPVEQACEVAMQIASALQHSHENQVVHSDVKSENVLCLADNEVACQVKLLDFGTAQLANRSGKDDQISGTPEYMAPERIRGNAPAPSNDIYSVGVLLYEMLTGEVPFVGDDPRKILEQQLELAPPNASEARGEPLDSELDAILVRSLAKDPAERYETAEEVVDALQAYLEAKGARQREAEERIGLEEFTREEAAADAFHALGIAAASLHSNGTIGIANQAFATFMREASPQDLEGRTIQETTLAKLHPGIREDLRLVAMKGKLINRRLVFRRKDGREVRVRLAMTPSHGRAGSCMLVLHALSSGEARNDE